MTVIQSSDLIRFISNIPTLNDGTLAVNRIESEQGFVSALYEPVYSLSVIARLTQDVINSGKIEVVNEPVHKNSIVRMALDSDLATYAPSIYLLIRAVALESFALVYHIEEEPEELRYVSPKDIQRTKMNISYIADYLGTEDKYRHMIETLRNMHTALGYLEHQVDVIIDERGRR